MATETMFPSDDVIENPPLAFDVPGEQVLCTLIRVMESPEGLVAFPDPAVVAADDRVLWYADPGVGPFELVLADDRDLDIVVAPDDGPAEPVPLRAVAARGGQGTPPSGRAWRSGASHLVGGWPKRVQVGVRYRLRRTDGSAAGPVQALLISVPRREVFGTSGTVRPNDPF